MTTLEQLKAKTAAAAPAPVTRVFFGEFNEFANFISPKGKTVSFYRGFCETTDPETIEYCETIPGVTDITGKVKEVPKAPVRQRNRNWASSNTPGAEPHMVNALELLQRAVASSANTPQAAQSTSVGQ